MNEETNDRPDAGAPTPEIADPSLAEEKQKSGLRDVPLKERGPQLALGFPSPGGALDKTLEMREWKGKQMRALGRAREEEGGDNLNMAEHATLVLSMMCSRFGPHDFSKLQAKERKFAISQAFVGDVFHAYCWLRLKALGPELFLDLTCPTCNYKFPWEGDLATLTVAVADRLEDAMWDYELHDPIQVRGRDASALRMGPAQWHHVERAQVEGRLDLEGGKLAMVAGVIRGVVGDEHDIPLTEAEIDELSGRDIENIVTRMSNTYVGPDMRVETQCERKICKAPILIPLDWSYQSFFGSSFRSPTGKRSTTSSSPSLTTREVA